MKNRALAAVVGVALLAASLWALIDLANLVSVSTLGSPEVLLMLVPSGLAIGFALLVWLHW
jgi:hypothetical protein